MKYPEWCIFKGDIRCPLAGLFEVDGRLCSACADFIAVRALKTTTITQLLIAYHDEEKAREVFEAIKRCSVEW